MVFLRFLSGLAPARGFIGRRFFLCRWRGDLNEFARTVAVAMAPHSTDVCITQALIDRFGAPLPKLNGDCRITRLDKKANSVSADMLCTGATVGKATMQSTWTGDHATGSIHFVGTVPRPAEWTSNSTSVFKSADCGSVQPFPIPEK
jgi:hypothetical protein